MAQAVVSICDPKITCSSHYKGKCTKHGEACDGVVPCSKRIQDFFITYTLF